MSNRSLNPLRLTHISACVQLLLSSAEGPATRATPSSHLHAGGSRLARKECSRTLAKVALAVNVL